MHNPEEAATELAEKLASRNRHAMFLLAAGASCAAGLPDLNGLKNAVESKLAGADQTKYQELGKVRNIEEILSRLRLITEVLTGTTDELDGLTATAAADLDKLLRLQNVNHAWSFRMKTILSIYDLSEYINWPRR